MKFHEIRSSGSRVAELFHAGRRVDGQTWRSQWSLFGKPRKRLKRCV